MQDEIVVQDEEIFVLMPKKAIAPGHIIIAPVNEYNILEQVPSNILTRMFQIANKLSSVLFEKMKCQGTNILIQNGVSAGQINQRFSINVIPRFENDNLKLEWTPTQTEPEKLHLTTAKFSEVEKQDKEKKYIEEQKSKVEEVKKSVLIKSSDEKKKRNYYVRSLEKVA
jgi:histidine triad (HIT) family protein